MAPQMALLDSGSDESMCPADFAPNVRLEQETSRRLRDVQGKIIPSMGKKVVKLEFLTQEQQGKMATANFVVGPVGTPLISAGKMVKQGFRINLELGNSYLEKGGHKIDLEIIRNSIYIPAWVRGVDKGAKEEGDAQDPEARGSRGPAPREEAREEGRGQAAQEGKEGLGVLGPDAAVRLMKARLRELGAPQYGSKKMLWERLQKKEKERQEDQEIQKEIARRERELQEDPRVRGPPLQIPGVTAPAELEKETHRLTHIPSKPWCEFCQRGKANDGAHESLGSDEIGRELPVISLDYGFAETNAEEGLGKADELATTLVGIDSSTGFPFAMAAESKGGSSKEFLAAAVAAYIDRIGHRKVRLRTDNEPSTMEIAKLVAKRREQETVVETTPRYSSASNGRA